MRFVFPVFYFFFSSRKSALPQGRLVCSPTQKLFVKTSWLLYAGSLKPGREWGIVDPRHFRPDCAPCRVCSRWQVGRTSAEDSQPQSRFPSLEPKLPQVSSEGTRWGYQQDPVSGEERACLISQAPHNLLAWRFSPGVSHRTS